MEELKKTEVPTKCAFPPSLLAVKTVDEIQALDETIDLCFEDDADAEREFREQILPRQKRKPRLFNKRTDRLFRR